MHSCVHGRRRTHPRPEGQLPVAAVRDPAPPARPAPAVVDQPPAEPHPPSRWRCVFESAAPPLRFRRRCNRK